MNFNINVAIEVNGQIILKEIPASIDFSATLWNGNLELPIKEAFALFNSDDVKLHFDDNISGDILVTGTNNVGVSFQGKHTIQIPED